MAIEVAIFLAVVFGIICGLILERLRKDINEAEDKKADAALPALTFGSKRAVARPDDVARLRHVSDARFLVKRLMTDNEAIVLSEIESIIDEIAEPWRVLAQVGLAQVIGSVSAEASASIDGQVAAMVIVTADRTPIAVVEYQSLGQVRGDDVMRDAIKREALRRAGIAFIEVRASDEPGDLRRDMTSLAARMRGIAEAKPLFGSSPAFAAGQDLPAPEEKKAPAKEKMVPPPLDQATAAKPPRKPRGKPASGVKP